MKTNKVVLLTRNDYDNLGVGYLASFLKSKGFEADIVNTSKRRAAILETIRNLNPLLVGFSVIFLNHIHEFTRLIKYLRENDVVCHFTAGGHYASLKYRELLEDIPELDSVVRFEGEYTLYELVSSIRSGKTWKDIKGIVYRSRNRLIVNDLRDVEKDIDRFPYPARTTFRTYAFGKKFTMILAGRGCLHNCSFCNTREFYRQAGGPLKRLREPESVVGEMKYLYNEKRCSVFIFHDDDFPVRYGKDHDWVYKFCSEIDRQGLKGKVVWKIDCRSDDIDEKCFLHMKMHGLFLVFIGIDDGTDEGLASLNKTISREDNIKGIDILRNLGIGFDYGFLLFQPSTTFQSFFKNLEFLREMVGDGYTPLTFLKLIPLYSTKIEKELLASGRLIKNGRYNEYRFPEEQMNLFSDFVINSFNEWQYAPRGLVNLSKWARNYFEIYYYYNGQTTRVRRFNRIIKNYISESNQYIAEKLNTVARYCYEMPENNGSYLKKERTKIKIKHDLYRKKIINTMSDFLNMG